MGPGRTAVAAALLGPVLVASACTASRRTAAPAPSATPATVASPAVTATTSRAPLAGRVVLIDPGHNRDNGRSPQTRELVDAGGLRKPCNSTGTATDAGLSESRFTMDVARLVAARLAALGARVVLSRAADAGWGPCVDQRGLLAARVGADLLLSIHADGAAASAHGFHVIRPALVRGHTEDIVASSARLATVVRDALVRAGMQPATYAGTDGISVRDDLGTLNRSDRPAVMVETFNMRNAVEAARFGSPAGEQRLADALAAGVAGYLAR